MSKDHSVVLGRSLARYFAALVLLLGIGLLALPALAAGRAIWKQTKVKEEDKSWKVSLEIHLQREPDLAHMPVRFAFTPTSYFERALVDGRKEPVTREIPLQHQQPIIESMDVGFLDPGTGKTSKRTRFSFRVTRDRGFEAGRYEVKVVDARTDEDMGGTTTLTLEGENEVVDRRSMVFDEKKPAAKSESAATERAAAEEKELTPEDEEFWAGGKSAPEEKSAPLPPPAHMQEKPGCGCRVAGAPSAPPLGLLGALGLAILRRRRRARAHDLADGRAV